MLATNINKNSTTVKQSFYILTFLLFLLTSGRIFGQTVDTTQQLRTSIQSDRLTTKSDIDIYEERGDFSPMQFFAVLFLFGIVLLGVGAGIILTVLGLLILFGFVSFGILSTSLIVGLHKKSFEKGFKIFIVLSSTFVGLLLGLVSFWLQNKIQHWWTTPFALVSGAICGVLGGLVFGVLTFYVFKRLSSYFKIKLKL